MGSFSTDLDKGFGLLWEKGAGAQGLLSQETARKAGGMAQLIVGGALTGAGLPLMLIGGPGQKAFEKGAQIMGAGYSACRGDDEQTSWLRGQQMRRSMGDFAALEVQPLVDKAQKSLRLSLKRAAKHTARGAREVVSTSSELLQKGREALGKPASLAHMKKLVKEDAAQAGQKAVATASLGASQVIRSARKCSAVVALSTLGLMGRGLSALVSASCKTDGVIRINDQKRPEENGSCQ